MGTEETKQTKQDEDPNIEMVEDDDIADSDEEAFEEKKVEKVAAKPSKKRNKDGTAKPKPGGAPTMGGGGHAVAKIEKVMMTASESHAAIAEYMERQNRPYSL